MDVSGPQYDICFKSLLLKITERLNLPPPVYNCGILSKKTYYVLLRSNASATSANYFQGDEKETVVGSIMDCAMKAICFLCKKYNVQICDVNYDQAIMFKRCALFYKEKAIELALELGEQADTKRPKLDHNIPIKIVKLDFFDLLTDITTHRLGIPMGTIDVMQTDGNTFQACIEMHYSNSSENPVYILSDSHADPLEAKQDVAKKAITQLQSDFKFTVRDVNFTPMVHAWAKCSLFQKKCKDLEKRVAEKRDGRVASLLTEQSGDNWSPGPSGTIKALAVPPTLPYKKRKMSNEPADRSKPGTSCFVPDAVVDAAFPKP